MSKITGKEYPLNTIFSSEFEYHIPAYQRPYAWTEEETATLFDDLYSFFREGQTENYFLGSIVLIKEENIPHADVIDGQQRLTTLTILFAVMAEFFTDLSRKTACLKRLQEEGDELAGFPAQPRLFLREKEQSFFNQYIQNLKTNDLAAKDPEQLDTEAKRHIRANCIILQERFKESFSSEDDVLAFSNFLLNRCFLVGVYTPTQQSAFRVFSVMNSRGLDLLSSDILKADTIGAISAEQQQAYTTKWDELENAAGREGFNEVFTHTRTIFAKERPKKNLLEEFREYVVKKTTPTELIDRYLEPYTNAYVTLRKCGFLSEQNAGDINSILKWLNKTSNYDWMPPAIKFFAEHENDSDYILWFVKKLERLASFLLVTSKDVNQRMDRYKWVLTEMESRPDHSLEHPLTKIELTNREKQDFIKALSGEIYSMVSQRRNFILQRLDSFVSDGAATYDSAVFTIEHVLPQTPTEESGWLDVWKNQADRDNWLNRIANLVPLTRKHNSAAQNFDFKTKKEKYFTNKDGTTSYALTTQVLQYSEWTPDIVSARQDELLGVFAEKWELAIGEDSEDMTDFLLAGRGANATAFINENMRLVVRRGSTIAADVTDSFQPNDLRSELLENGTIVDYVFVTDWEAKSPSAAAAIVLGRSANGRTEWKRLDGMTAGQAGL